MQIGLISCTKSQQSHPAPARELYQHSALFRSALAYLEGRVDRVYVLSAKYGVLPLEQIAVPNDLTLESAAPAYRRNWAYNVLRDLRARHGPSLAGITFEFHTTEPYSEELRPLLRDAGATCLFPVAGLGPHQRLRFYAGARSDGGGGRRRAVRRSPRTGVSRRTALSGPGWHSFPIEPAEDAHGAARRDLVVPEEHAVRRLNEHGLFVYFDGDRALYVGKASAETLVERALGYLCAAPGETTVGRVIREHATRLVIGGAGTDPAAARRMELAQIVALEPVLNEGFIYATAAERAQYGLSDEAGAEAD